MKHPGFMIAVAMIAVPSTAQGAGLSPACKPAKAMSCGFTTPAALGVRTGAWLGGCRNGKADGPGVVRVAVAGRPPVLWYGPMTSGRPGRGVMARDGDYYPEAGADRAANVNVFATAAAAARTAARHLAAQNNQPSARFYAAEAVKLEQTLD